MSESILTVIPPMLSERRQEMDRREFSWAGDRHLSPGLRRRFHILLMLLVPLAFVAWQWRFVRNAPVWLARAHWADRSDLYLGSTNGIPNASLVQQARNYLADIDHLDASGNITAPEDLRRLGAHLDTAWFKRHAPDTADFNPFITPGGSFVVTWLYVPGGQKSTWKSARTDTNWYNLRGEPSYPVCKLSILMAPDLRLTSMVLSPIHS